MGKHSFDPATLILPVLTMGMRGFSLVGRFGLSLYLAKYLSLPDVGLFGLVTGVTSMLPAIAGWGLNYFLIRDIVGQPKLISGTLIRDRLVVTLFSIAVLLVLTVPFVLVFRVLPSPRLTVLVVAVIMLESMAFDLHLALISLGHALAANTLLFVRSAAWIFPVVGLGILMPAWRTLDFIFAAWLVGEIACFASLFWILRAWPLRAIIATKIETKWATATIRKGWLIYLSELGMCVTAVLDRYVVNHFLGISLTGVYSLYWILANGVNVLVSSGIIQPATPALLTAYNIGDYGRVRDIMRKTLARTVATGISLSVVAGLAFPPLLGYLGKSNIAAYGFVFWVILAGTCVRMIADLFTFELSCRHLDRACALTNLLGVPLTFIFNIAGIEAFGLVGAGMSLVATHLVLALIRFRFLSIENSRMAIAEHAAPSAPIRVTKDL